MSRSPIVHASVLVTILALDAFWLWLTGRIDPYLENMETIFFAILSRVLVYAWVMYTVIPAIYCSKNFTLSNVCMTGAVKGFTAFGMWNFATVDSFTDVGMPLLDTCWGMILTVIASLVSLHMEGIPITT